MVRVRVRVRVRVFSFSLLLLSSQVFESSCRIYSCRLLSCHVLFALVSFGLCHRFTQCLPEQTQLQLAKRTWS